MSVLISIVKFTVAIKQFSSITIIGDLSFNFQELFVKDKAKTRNIAEMQANDGIGDFIGSVNYEESSVQLIEKLFRLAAIHNTVIICLLHIAPSIIIL